MIDYISHKVLAFIQKKIRVTLTSILSSDAQNRCILKFEKSNKAICSINLMKYIDFSYIVSNKGFQKNVENIMSIFQNTDIHDIKNKKFVMRISRGEIVFRIEDNIYRDTLNIIGGKSALIVLSISGINMIKILDLMEYFKSLYTSWNGNTVEDIGAELGENRIRIASSNNSFDIPLWKIAICIPDKDSIFRSNYEYYYLSRLGKYMYQIDPILNLKDIEKENGIILNKDELFGNIFPCLEFARLVYPKAKVIHGNIEYKNNGKLLLSL